MDDVIDDSMTGKMALAPTAAQSMSSQFVHLCATVTAPVWPSQRGSGSQDNSSPDGLIIHSQATCRDGKNIQLGSGFCISTSQKTSSGSIIRGLVQETISYPAGNWNIPALLCEGGRLCRRKIFMQLRPFQ